MSGPYAGRDPIVDDPDQVVVRDRRRLDPETGAVRGTAFSAEHAPPAEDVVDVTGTDVTGTDVVTGTDPTADAVLELTADLQRVLAEYANYRKRVERDRVAVVEMATAGLLSGLLPVLDDLDRARQHGDLTGAFKGVADQLEAVTSKLGLERFGEAGEPFDPAVHEALMQAEPDPTQSVPTCAAVLQPGFRLVGSARTGGGPRVLRPARVSVAEPGTAAPCAPAG